MHEKVITSVDPCGGGSVINTREDQQSACEKAITSVHEKAIASVDSGGGRLMIDTEDQQSLHMKGDCLHVKR